MNILLLCVDDLRPQFGCYGLDWMQAPHIDRLASEGVLFERNYCQYPICGPSRASFLSGVRPTPVRFTEWNCRIDQDYPGALTLPEQFRNHGYITQCFGKVFHDEDDHSQAWSREQWRPTEAFGCGPLAYALESNREFLKANQRGPAFEAAPVEDDAYADSWIATRAVEELRSLKEETDPFFLAVGFLKPHLPFTAPSQYWNLYADAPAATNPAPPDNVPPEALTNWAELRNYRGIPENGPLDPNQAQALVQGYAACVSYLDAQVGRVLDEVDELGLREDTLVVLMTDHAWQLGEHGLWAKHCLFERALHCPLLFRGPGIHAGARESGLTENLDVYPTLCDLAGIPTPSHVEGTTLRPSLENSGAAGREAAFSRMNNGESLRTDRYRYSEWRTADGDITARMLYDHDADPEENFNIAESSAASEIVASLSRQLARHLAQ